MFNPFDLASVLEIAKKRIYSEEENINAKKKVGKIFRDSIAGAKQKNCLYCKKEVSSFCNSHTVPQFSLKNIAKDGKLYLFNKLINLPIRKDEEGVKQTGTFRLICKDCDSKIFKEYENTDNLEAYPTDIILYQIAMKNYLMGISKRLIEYEVYSQTKKTFADPLDIEKTVHSLQDLDLDEYKKGFVRAKKLCTDNAKNAYNIISFISLDYTVPIAFQGIIALVTDLEGRLINDLNCSNHNYEIQSLHVCVFPLKNKSSIFIFVDRKYKRYRQFAKQFSKLTRDEQLNIINKMIFMYSEDFYLSKTLENNLKNKNLEEIVCVTPTSYCGPAIMPKKEIKAALRKKTMVRHDLSKYDKTPNFLSNEYAIEFND